MTPQTRQQLKYLLSDFITLNIGWFLFDIARFFALPPEESVCGLHRFLLYNTLILGQILIPLVMIGLYALSGAYNKGGTLYRSRLDEFLNTAFISFVGMIGIYFTVLIDNNIPERMANYDLMAILYLSLLLPTAIGRFLISRASARRIRRGDYCVNTLIVGASDTYRRKIERIMDASTLSGLRPVACVADSSSDRSENIAGLPVYDSEDIEGLCKRLKIGALVVLPSIEGNESMGATIDSLYSLHVPIMVCAELLGKGVLQPRVAGVANEPLVDITNANIPASVANLKRLGDIVVSSLSLLLLSPVLAVLAIGVRLDSPGPVFYRQERVGYHGHLFRIIKFRSMYTDAENDGPQLSSGADDPRVTRIGRFLRKYRLDELPQFWNVLVGEMSMVGPRPERKYYIDSILKRVPWYSLMRQVRPGITSWGMVKYGYASNIEEMVERSAYDLLYLRNISFAVDLKILFHTVSTVFKGKGI